MSLTALAIALSLAASPVLAAPLAQFQWEKRLLVLLVEANDGSLTKQVDMLAQAQDGLAERDMIVLAVQGNDVRSVYGSTDGLDAQALRTNLGGDDAGPFEAVLIGKDGGVKQRWPQPVSTEELFAIIDAMPMRASEMRRSHK
jgi:hypothetical protein